MVQVPKFKGYTDSRQYLMTYEATMNSSRGDEVAMEESNTEELSQQEKHLRAHEKDQP